MFLAQDRYGKMDQLIEQIAFFVTIGGHPFRHLSASRQSPIIAYESSVFSVGLPFIERSRASSISNGD
jgi:hypothetical protein